MSCTRSRERWLNVAAPAAGAGGVAPDGAEGVAAVVPAIGGRGNG